jgi:CTP:molybdopterin cytidylyltransferase MocA
MGRPKLLLPWGDATVLDATLAALGGGGVETVVVVAEPGGPLAGWQPPPAVERVENPRPEEGMLSSVVAGWRRLADGPERLLLVCPADLPALQPGTVAALIAAQRSHGGLVVPSLAGRQGHPLLVPWRWARHIPELDPTIGLRQLLALAAGELLRVPVADPGTVRDVDTPEAYEELRPR